MLSVKVLSPLLLGKEIYFLKKSAGESAGERTGRRELSLGKRLHLLGPVGQKVKEQTESCVAHKGIGRSHLSIARRRASG